MDGTYLLVDETGNATEISGEIKIGRGKSSDLVVEDALVSRHHATVWMEDEKLMLRDEDSVNGTFVNHKQIYDPIELKDQDVVQVGDALLTVRAPLAESKTVKKSKKSAKAKEVVEEESEKEAEKIIEELEETVGEMEAAEPAEEVVEVEGKAGGMDTKKLLLIGAVLLVVLCCCMIVIVAGWFLLSNRGLYSLIESGQMLSPILQFASERMSEIVLPI